MRDRSTHQSESPSRKFVPDMVALEGRLLLSRAVSFPDGTTFVFPIFPRLPRTGGALLQSGTALTVGVGQRTSNTVNVSNLGGQAVSVEWNGRPTHSVTNVQAILVQAAVSRRDQVLVDLGAATALATAGPSGVTTALGFARNVSHPVHALISPRTSPTAVQTGTVLTIRDTSPRITSLAISSVNSGQQVQVEWSGSGIRSFTGVSTIIVDIANGRRDFIALDNVVSKSP